MPENVCYDPLKDDCSGFALIFVEDDPLPDELPAGAVVSWPQHRPLPKLPPGLGLEVRAEGGAHFHTGQDWSLFLQDLESFDLGRVEEVLEAAATAGCVRVVAGSVRAREGGAQDYRYRLYSLLRLLCDRLKLKFSIYESRPLEKHERFNQYLASRRGCCRGPAGP